MINSLFLVLLGFAIGWLVFKRPDVATEIIEDLKEQLGLKK